MIPTIPYIEAKFDEFNKLIFGGELPRIPIVLGSATRVVGSTLQTQLQGTRISKISSKNLHPVPKNDTPLCYFCRGIKKNTYCKNLKCFEK